MSKPTHIELASSVKRAGYGLPTTSVLVDFVEKDVDELVRLCDAMIAAREFNTEDDFNTEDEALERIDEWLRRHNSRGVDWT